MTVITQGVKSGESVVARGQLQLSPGMKVAAQEEKQPHDGGANGAAADQ
jgi:hypothetical protein